VTQRPCASVRVLISALAFLPVIALQKHCRRLWCTSAEGVHKGCRTQHMPLADGTSCGPGMVGFSKGESCIQSVWNERLLSSAFLHFSLFAVTCCSASWGDCIAGNSIVSAEVNI
jgi:hypothetical protein